MTIRYALYAIVVALMALLIHHFGGRWWAQRQVNQILFQGITIGKVGNSDLQRELDEGRRKIVEAEFVSAACRNDHASAKTFLRAGYSPNSRNGNGITPLHCASGLGNLALAKDLIAAGADLKARSDEDELMPVHYAAAYRQWELVRFLLKKGVSINEPSKAGTPVMTVGDHDVMRKMRQMNPTGNTLQEKKEPLATSISTLASLGATLDMVAPNGNTLMHHAALEQDVALMDTLLTRHGLSANVKNSRGETPLIHAIKEVSWKARDGAASHVAMVEWLVTNGVDINARDEKGWSIALWAVWYKDLLALLSGLDYDVADNQGQSVWSSLGGYMVQFARTQATIGVPLMLNGQPGTGPLHVAAKEPSLDDLVYFLQRGVKPDQLDQAGLTPLHVVLQSSGGVGDARKNRQLIVKTLLDAGADVNARTPQGLTPLMLAKDKPGEITQLLVDHKADVNASAMENGKPVSVLDYFVCHANTVGIQVLVTAGARKSGL